MLVRNIAAIAIIELDGGQRSKSLAHRPIGTLAAADDGLDMDWAEREYGRCPHTDGRVRRRIVRLGRA